MGAGEEGEWEGGKENITGLLSKRQGNSSINVNIVGRNGIPKGDFKTKEVLCSLHRVQT